LVTGARSRGIACAITSGMACVTFGVSEATKDCDLLCSQDSVGDLLGLLGETTLGGRLPSYNPTAMEWLPDVREHFTLLAV